MNYYYLKKIWHSISKYIKILKIIKRYHINIFTINLNLKIEDD